MDLTIPIAVSYVVGTICGFLLSWKFVAGLATDAAIKVLIDTGYLKSKTDADGNLELIPLNKND